MTLRGLPAPVPEVSVDVTHVYDSESEVDTGILSSTAPEWFQGRRPLQYQVLSLGVYMIVIVQQVE